MEAGSSNSGGSNSDRERDRAVSEMHMSIDCQSFVNVGQLMGSRHGTAGGSNSNSNADDLGSCLSDDFDQIFHPGGGSASSAWSGRALYGRGSATDGDDDDDDDESLLPALPSRCTTPGLDADDVEDSSTATEGVSSRTPPRLRDSWLHVPTRGDGGTAAAGEAQQQPDRVDTEVVDGPEDAAGIDPQQQQRLCDAAAAAARARRAAAVALADCGECLARAVDKAAAVAASQLQQLVRVVNEQAEAGADACARGKQVVVKAVDNVPQAPVRVWLGRIAGSLVIGAVLGGAAAYYALPRAMTGCASAAGDAGSASSASPRWDTGRGASFGAGEPGEGAEQGFGDRLNKALFAARAGEAAAQQVLLEEVRNILAATGKSGGISAEQILRQFNARRFNEASKAWSAAEGSVAGSDPLDSLFFAPGSTPTTPPADPSTPPPDSSQQQHQQQHQHQHQHQQHQPQQQPFIPDGAAPATECAGGASGSSFCSTAAPAARPRVQQYRRPCPGWRVGAC